VETGRAGRSLEATYRAVLTGHEDRPQPAVATVPAIATATVRETSSDETLVERIAAGNKLAMHALFARHRTSIYRWLLRFVSNETLAEDLLSEVFLDVWRQAGRFEYRSSVSTWLMSIARHKALSARRHRTDAELDEKIESTIADPADNPEIALQEKDRGELVRRVLIRLSPEHREVSDLVYCHEKSVDEVAHILDVPTRDRKDTYVLCPKEIGRVGRLFLYRPLGTNGRPSLSMRALKFNAVVARQSNQPAWSSKLVTSSPCRSSAWQIQGEVRSSWKATSPRPSSKNSVTPGRVD
jgi:RNA polymerase sigma-70 factor (ECF subfamily)